MNHMINAKKMKISNVSEILARIFLLYVPLACMIVYILSPFYWCINTAFKMSEHITSRIVYYLPPVPTFQNFVYAWNTGGFEKYFLNSVFVSTSSMICVVFFSILASYPLTRFKFAGRRTVLLTLLSTQFLPHAMLLIPLFIIFTKISLVNSLWSVVIAIITFQLPYNTVLMRGFMAGVPIDIEEAAMIDGCSRMQTIFKVVLPLLLPGVVAAGSFAFVSAWREFLFTLILIMSKEKLTLSVGLSQMLNEYRVDYGFIAAGATISMIPPVLLFAYIQRYLVAGLASGAVKG